MAPLAKAQSRPAQSKEPMDSIAMSHAPWSAAALPQPFPSPAMRGVPQCRLAPARRYLGNIVITDVPQRGPVLSCAMYAPPARVRLDWLPTGVAHSWRKPGLAYGIPLGFKVRLADPGDAPSSIDVLEILLTAPDLPPSTNRWHAGMCGAGVARKQGGPQFILSNLSRSIANRVLSFH
jgi:hypothetical protein